MTRTPLLIILAAAAALAGCNKENHTIVAGPESDDNDTNSAANQPVAMPPAIEASKIYRCGDNKLVYVNWLSDNKSATVRTGQSDSPVQVSAAEAGQPMRLRAAMRSAEQRPRPRSRSPCPAVARNPARPEALPLTRLLRPWMAAEGE